jgi:uncharacterized Zn-binding protein involved in type VI secretion
MPGIAFNGSKTNDVTTNDIDYRRWNPCKFLSCDADGNCSCVGGWDYFSGGSSIIHGTVVASISNVFVNGNPLARLNDNVTETETPQVNGEPIANHTGGTGKITSANSKSVYAGGVLVATIGSTVKTHSTPNTTIKDGSTNVFIGG